MAFYPPNNYVTLTLDTSVHPTGLGTGDLTITVNEDISGLEAQGFLNVDRYTPGSREIIKWTSYVSGTKTLTVLRGQDGTSAHTHATTCTIVVSAVKAYWDALKAYVDSSLVSPPSGIGTTTPAAGAFTTLATSGTYTASGAIAANGGLTSTYDLGPALYSSPTRSSGSGGLYGTQFSPTASGGTPSEIIGSTFTPTVSGASASVAYALFSSVTLSSGSITNRYLAYDNLSAGTNQYFLGLGYASGGFLSGVTTHDTESDELKVNVNGTVKYIKLYT